MPLTDFLLNQEQEAHTFRINPKDTVVGMGIPIDPSRDTSTISYDASPQIVYKPYAYTVTNSSWFGLLSNPNDEGSDEKRWRRYWAEFFVSKETPYTKFTANRGHGTVRGLMKMPCTIAIRKKPMCPAQRAHRNFLVRVSRPTGFLHTRPLV